jgi:hypothetical protein
MAEGSGYEYLLTGFLARKRKSPGEPAGTVGPEEDKTCKQWKLSS